jgi:hypothetical protein
MSTAGAAFVYTSPTGLGLNAFYWENFGGGGGVVDVKELEICLEKSGGVTSIRYMVEENDLGMLDNIQTSLQTASNTNSDLKPGPASVVQRPIEAYHSTNEPPSALSEDDQGPMSRSPSILSATHMKKEERIECDFSSLFPGDFVTSELREACYMEITAFSLDGLHVEYPVAGPARVFDSCNPTKGSNELGSPNQDCPNGGPGEGIGGSPLHQANQAYQNCDAKRNLLIVPERNDVNPIPAGAGGCLLFHFVIPLVLQGAGVLNIPRGTTVMYTVSTF